MRPIKPKIKKIATTISTGILALHLLTQTNHSLNNLYHHFLPDKQRQEFVREFGFPLKGFDSDISGYMGTGLYTIGDVIYKEMLERPFSLSSLSIRSPNYFKESIFDQIGYIITTDNGGYYDPITGAIVVEDGSPSALHHEIKHRKTFEIDKIHPEFLERWKNLAKRKNGESIYKPGLEQICLRFRLLNKLVDNPSNYEENNRYGFVSDYARTNVYEDIAELCEKVESISIQGGLSELFDYSPKTHQNLRPKIQLAQEYGLIPREFEDFMVLTLKYRNLHGENGYYDKSGAEEFLKNLDAFAKKHPRSVYTADLREAKAGVYQSMLALKDVKDKDGQKKLIGLYKDVLLSPYKDRVAYGVSLTRLKDLYRNLGDINKYEIYAKADTLHSERFFGGFMMLSKEGVNDFLKEKGELN